MSISLLNLLMSVSELGVVIGVALEGTEYIPPIHKRWPWLEKLGFMVLVIALLGDWHFQSKINEHLTNDLIAADVRIATLLPRTALLNGGGLKLVLAVAARYSGQKFEIFENLETADDREEVHLCAVQIDAVLNGSGWLDPLGKKNAPTKGWNIGHDPPNRNGVHGILIETHFDAPQQTKAAADALTKALASADLVAYHNSSPLKDVAVPSTDVIVITVGRRLEF
jgi:hypothetical protein